jgi:hypothetical protein
VLTARRRRLERQGRSDAAVRWRSATVTVAPYPAGGVLMQCRHTSSLDHLWTGVSSEPKPVMKGIPVATIWSLVRPVLTASGLFRLGAT